MLIERLEEWRPSYREGDSILVEDGGALSMLKAVVIHNGIQHSCIRYTDDRLVSVRVGKPETDIVKSSELRPVTVLKEVNKPTFQEGQEVFVDLGIDSVKATMVAYGESFCCVKYPDNALRKSYNSIVETCKIQAKLVFQEGQEVWVAFKDGNNKYKATVIATGEHFTCVHSWVGCGSMEKKEIVGNERVFALEYDKVKTIKIGEFDVPEPLREAPTKGTRVYVVILRSKQLQSSYLFGTVASSYTNELQDIARGQAHLTKEAATLHAKALLSFTTMELSDA